jgi:hypothetical protein
MSEIVPVLPPRASPSEVFPPRRRAQVEVDRLARDAPLPPRVLRTTGFMRPELAERVSDWFTGTPAAPVAAIQQSYQALARETARLFEILTHAQSLGGRGVQVRYCLSGSGRARNCQSFSSLFALP